MNVVLWILQGLLAVVFLMAGFMKVSKSKDKLKEMGGKHLDWVDDVSASTIRLIGILELLAGIGIILPQLTGILPRLTPLAAVGLVLTMIGAMMLNVRESNGPKTIMTNIVSNNAAAAIGTPIGISIAQELGVSPEPFILAVLFGANMSFATPYGYQTNLLVMSAGGYKFADFLRVGIPLTVVMWVGFSLVLPMLYEL